MSASSRRTFIKVLLGGTAAAMLVPRRSWGADGAGVRHSTFVMGQVATITAYGAPREVLDAAITEAFAILRRVDTLMSVFSETSDLGRVNASAGRASVPVDPWTADVIAEAVAYARSTTGAYDPTVEPLMVAWGFRTPRAAQPTDREITAALEAVGVGHISAASGAVDSLGRIGLDVPGAKLDLGGIAVGYAIDRVRESMYRHGVASALIDVSGDLFAIGAPPDEDGWRIGIVDPHQPDSTITSCVISNEALATSGNYRSVVVYNARTFGHILNTHDGYPSHAIASATVIAPSGIAADALSLAAFVNPSLNLPECRSIRVLNSGDLVHTG